MKKSTALRIFFGLLFLESFLLLKLTEFPFFLFFGAIFFGSLTIRRSAEAPAGSMTHRPGVPIRNDRRGRR